MLEGGVDLFLVETIFDTLNAKAAIFALDELMVETGERLPVIVSGTVTDASGRILSGQTVAAFWHSVRHARPLAVGLNCALGAALMRPYIEELSKVAADTWISCYPNAGLPNPMSETGFDETPEVTGALLEEFARAGFLNIAGGCCGTTPAHIREIAQRVAAYRPRSRRDPLFTPLRVAARVLAVPTAHAAPARCKPERRYDLPPRLPGKALVGGGNARSSSLSIATGPGTTRSVTASPGGGVSTTTRRLTTPRPIR